MKHKIALLAVAFISVFAACKKNQPFAGAKIYQKIDFRQNATATYTYNGDGTIATIKSTNGSDTTFSYLGDTVMETDYATNGITPSSGYFFIKNSSGLADTAQGINGQQNYSYAYVYDGNIMLTQSKVYLASGPTRNLELTYDYTNSGKNIYEMITTNNANGGTQTFDYYTFFSSNSNSIGVQDQGKYHLGASTTSPVQSDIFIKAPSDTLYTISYRYAYDGSGRIDTLVSYKRLHGVLTSTLVDSMAFTYY